MSSPETKKKRQALPSVLSNIRNAQAAIGRATTTSTDEPHHEWEMREREGNVILSPLMQPPVDRRNQTASSSYSSSSYATTLNNFSQRFGNEWRTQKRRLRRKDGVVPSSFYFAVGCFFFAFPIIFILYILARHSVFGDEGYGSGTIVQKQHVESSSTIVINPDDEIRGKIFGVNVNDGKDLDQQKEEDGSVDPTSNDGVAQSYGDMAGQKESHHDSFIPSTKVDIATNDDETGHGPDVESVEKSLPPSSDQTEDTLDKTKKVSEDKLLRGSHPKSTGNEQQTLSADNLVKDGDRRRILRDFAVAVAAAAV